MKNHYICSIFTLLFLIFACALPAYAQDIVVVKSAEIQPYNDTLLGFKRACSADYQEYILDQLRPGELSQKLAVEQPDLILTIGLNAFQAVRDYSRAPIVYTMISNIHALQIKEDNITGISMNISAEMQLESLLKSLPSVKRIGLLYDPSKTAHLYDDVQTAARARGLTVVSRKVSSAAEVPDAINSIRPDIDVLWMLPDTTVITRETLEYLLLVSLDHRIPILTFSEKYLEKGAFISISIDTGDIGEQACDMAKKILRAQSATNVQAENPRKAVVQINNKVRPLVIGSKKMVQFSEGRRTKR